MTYSASENMIEITDAARAYGVSRSTIDCFVETGYLRIEKEGAGAKFLNKKSLAAVFGEPLHDALTPDIVEDSLSENPADTSSTINLSSEIQVESISSPAESATTIATPDGVIENAEAQKSESEISLEAELVKFKNIASVQEQILKVRDDQIKELKEERVWLRERLERMEQSAQRDQLLLLASNETLRNIVSTKNRSPLRTALEWFGFVEPNK